ncbi:MAG: DUF4336 domain-containing protein [Candidatus Omnitrophica bacterium]|nr:DUF4336 domain-containing protein [Candidatus Omnitrophota bacterium]MDE2232242.1 DUF4336 domain-containing protein [Candidatus Omnitrophota bacterium]
MLEKIDDALWLAEGEIVSFYGFPYPTRSVIVRLSGGDLWVWSPVKLTDELRGQIEGLGRVAHLVSPNKLHHLYLKSWKAAYPDAKLWGPQSTIRRHSGLEFCPALNDTTPCPWQPDIDQAWFRGSFFMDEVVFFHRSSATVIIADLIEAFSESFLLKHWKWWQRPLATLDGIVLKKHQAPLEWRLSFLDRSPARAARARILSWSCKRVIMAHGQWQRSDGHAFLRSSFDWLG